MKTEVLLAFAGYIQCFLGGLMIGGAIQYPSDGSAITFGLGTASIGGGLFLMMLAAFGTRGTKARREREDDSGYVDDPMLGPWKRKRKEREDG